MMTFAHDRRPGTLLGRRGARPAALTAAIALAVAGGVLLGAPSAHAARDTPDDAVGDVPAALACTGFADYDAVVGTTGSSVTLAGPTGDETSVTYTVDGTTQTTTSDPVTFAVDGDGRTFVASSAATGSGSTEVGYSVYPDGGRISGPNRYETSVQVGVDTNPGACANTVYIASGESFPDALSSTPLVVSSAFGELLLSQRDTLTNAVQDEIFESGATRVVLVGGTAALSPALCGQMPDSIVSCTRISGPDRYATSLAIADQLLGSSTTPEAFVVSGERFPDAVSVAGVAAFYGVPVVLVPGSASTIPPSTLAWLSEHVTDGVGIVGGTASVSAGIEAQLRGLYGAVAVERYSGANRYETSAALLTAAGGAYFGAPYALLASGERFPDALAGGVLAGSSGMPLLLTAPTCLPAPIEQTISILDPAGVVAIGGTAAVSDAALTQPC